MFVFKAPNKQKIFLSYCHANKNIVHEIADRLKEVFTIWIDVDNLKAGDDQNMEIANGIRSTTIFLPFINENYCKSKACKKEFALAERIGKQMLPIMLQREATNGIDLTIADLTTFYAFRPPNVFDPWSEALYQKLVNNILDLTKDVKP